MMGRILHNRTESNMARTRTNYVADTPDHSGLVLAGVVFLILMFAGAGAGNSGAVPMFKNTFMPSVLWTYGTLAVVSLILVFIGQHTASLIIAWLPALLMYFGEELMKIAVHFF